MAFPISFEDVLRARERIAPHLAKTPLRSYPLLDAAVGSGIQVLVKHENVNPTGAFKIRNALSAMTALAPEALKKGVVAASTGNHGQGLAYAGRLLGAPVTVCVPVGNNPDKNAAMRGYGATVVEQGKDYDESTGVADRLVREQGMTLVHSTNNKHVLAGAGTITLEIVEEAPSLDAVVIATGGGSQAVGAITVARRLMPNLAVYAVGAQGAPALHDSWLAKKPVEHENVATFAEGIATRRSYELTLSALIEGLAGFVTVSEGEIEDALRLYLATAHHLVEGATAAGLAGLRKLAPRLSGKTVALIASGGNLDMKTLKRVVAGMMVSSDLST